MAEVCIQLDATQQLPMYVLPPCITPLLSVLSPVCASCRAHIWLALHTGCAVPCRRPGSPEGVTPEQAAKHSSPVWSTRCWKQFSGGLPSPGAAQGRFLPVQGSPGSAYPPQELHSDTRRSRAPHIPACGTWDMLGSPLMAHPAGRSAAPRLLCACSLAQSL